MPCSSTTRNDSTSCWKSSSNPCGSSSPSPRFTSRGSEAAVTEKKIRVLIAKAGLDGHDRGAKVIARALRDAGMEVIYTGLRQSVDTIVKSAVQQDVNVVAVSILSGAHMTVLPAILKGLRKFGKKDVLITGGGIIPPEDQIR